MLMDPHPSQHHEGPQHATATGKLRQSLKARFEVFD